MPRYALYYAPASGSELDRFGAHWLGWDVEAATPCAQIEVPGLSPETVAQATAEPRKYGFHGTLKPPFHLAEGYSEDDLRAALSAFCARRRPFALPAWKLTWLGSFAALTPSAPCPALHALANACVEEFDPFRAPPAPGELERRRARGLSPRQDAALLRWGYPYVMEDFRFHLTLSGPIHDALLRETLSAALAPLTAPFCKESSTLDGIALYVQPDTSSPFQRVWHCPFGKDISPGNNPTHS